MNLVRDLKALTLVSTPLKTRRSLDSHVQSSDVAEGVNPAGTRYGLQVSPGIALKSDRIWSIIVRVWTSGIHTPSASFSDSAETMPFLLGEDQTSRGHQIDRRIQNLTRLIVFHGKSAYLSEVVGWERPATLEFPLSGLPCHP